MTARTKTTRKAVAVPTPKEAAPGAHKLPGGKAIASQREGERVRIDVAPGQDNVFKPMGGSDCHDFNSVLLREALGAVWVQKQEPDSEASSIAAVAAALAAFKPTDEIEGMLAAQATAMHFQAMECFRRAVVPNQPSDAAARLRKDGANLARGMTDMLEALDRKRGKGPQVVRVERVVVHEGGQAIVGNVQAGTPRGQLGQDVPGQTVDGSGVRLAVEGGGTGQ